MNRRNSLRLLTALGTGLAALPRSAKALGKKTRPLGMTYVDGIREGIAKIRETESGNLLRASEAIAKIRKNGGNCFCQWETGHSFDGDMYPDRPGDTDLFVLGYSMVNPATSCW